MTSARRVNRSFRLSSSSMANAGTRGADTLSLDGSAGSLELGARGRGERNPLDGVRPVGVSRPEKLHGSIALADEAGGEECFRIDNLAVDLGELPEVHDLARHLEWIGKPTLGQPTIHRHLATLEARVRLAARSSLVALVTLAGGLAQTRAWYATDPPAPRAGPGSRAERRKCDRRVVGLVCHSYSLAGDTSTRCRTLYNIPRTAAVLRSRTVCWWRRRPNASSVRRMVAGCPMPERICFTFSSAASPSAGIVAA